MSYKVTYSKETKPKDFFYRIQIPIAGLLLLLALLNATHCYSGDFSGMKEKIMPWTKPQVQAAFLSLRENLAQGEPISESVEAFCFEILRENYENTDE